MAALIFFSFCFLGPHLWHIEVPRRGVESELSLTDVPSVLCGGDGVPHFPDGGTQAPRTAVTQPPGQGQCWCPGALGSCATGRVPSDSSGETPPDVPKPRRRLEEKQGKDAWGREGLLSDTQNHAARGRDAQLLPR